MVRQKHSAPGAVFSVYCRLWREAATKVSVGTASGGGGDGPTHSGTAIAAPATPTPTPTPTRDSLTPTRGVSTPTSDTDTHTGHLDTDSEGSAGFLDIITEGKPDTDLLYKDTDSDTEGRTGRDARTQPAPSTAAQTPRRLPGRCCALAGAYGGARACG